MRKLNCCIIIILLCICSSYAQVKKLGLLTPGKTRPRVEFGMKQLAKTLRKQGYVFIKPQGVNNQTVVLGLVNDPMIQKYVQQYHIVPKVDAKKESFWLHKTAESPLFVIANDDSGLLYACLELAERVEQQKHFPSSISYADSPEMVMRGTCVGLQKPTLLPGREVYEYPYTPESFPWFYDKALWTKYLDMMVANRYNTLYLWNGHPFASLVKLKEYPYALEVDETTFQKNEEMFRFLTQEADKRGIWVIQMFYNIIVSKPFAEHHNLKTQDRNRPITPLIADYTRKSIAAFVSKYPNVGLLITLGEAMEGVGQDDVDWFTKTIIPGVKDGLQAIGQTYEPPIVLRAHDTDAPRVMKEALPIYKNLYTMAKYNGEALTTYTPRGSWAELHKSLSKIGTVHIENVHLLSNLEPFRYSSPDFIQKSVTAMHQVYGANGLHLYPQASYWDWPYAADKTPVRLLQLDRDEMWYKTWARYAWKSNRSRQEEQMYWQQYLSQRFGISLNDAQLLLDSYEETGEIAPKLLRRYGITDGNRQTLTLGMLMTQLINPYRYGLFTLLYESEAPAGEMLIDYAEKDWKKQGHLGETPLQIANEVVAHGQKAQQAIDKIAKAMANQAEFGRFKNDVHCYNAMAQFFAEKVYAAIAVLRYKYSNDLKDLKEALPHLQKSVAYYDTLVGLTKDTYLYANSMQTKQRKIPMRGADATFIHWKEMLPIYQKELTRFQFCLDSLQQSPKAQQKEIHYLKPAEVTLASGTIPYKSLQIGQSVFADTTIHLQAIAPEISQLKALLLPLKQQQKEGTSISFYTAKPVKVLVGYFNEKKGMFSTAKSPFLPKPELEIDASANNFGQAESKISNALLAGDLPPINVHTFSFGAGNQTLTLGKGACLILGFIEDSQNVPIFDAGLAGNQKNIDWLFE